MASTKVVNIRKEACDTPLDGYFGNPFVGPAAIPKYKVWFYERVQRDPEFLRRVLELRGHVLGCFCKPKKCHGDVIMEFLEGGCRACQGRGMREDPPPVEHPECGTNLVFCECPKGREDERDYHLLMEASPGMAANPSPVGGSAAPHEGG